MKKNTLIAASLVVMTLASCSTNGLGGGLMGNGYGSQQGVNAAAGAASNTASQLGSLLSTAASGNNLGNLLTSIIGLDKMQQRDLIGTWHYSQPGCAFTSEQTLAKAGGEAIAANVKEKLASTYSKVGIKSNNTGFTFKEDGTFTATLLGHSVNGTYTFNEKDQSITLNSMFISITGYVKKNVDGIALLFESKKVLNILQMVGAASGNSTLSTVAELSTNYDGVRVGFDMKK